MKAVLSRTYADKETRGCFYVFDGDRSLLNVKTLELPDKGNAQNVSCIPEGVYKVKRISSPTRGIVFHVQDVPGRTAILIHVGNYAAGVKVDTEGCILPGLRFVDINGDGNLDVAESAKAMSLLLTTLYDEFEMHII